MTDSNSGFTRNVKPLNKTCTGVSKSKKRAWRDTNKQEWLKIYQDYMQDRTKRQPQPMDIQGRLSEDIVVGRNFFSISSSTNTNLKKGSLNRLKRLKSDCVKRVKTVKDLKQSSKRRRIRNDLEGASSKDFKQCIPERIIEDPDSREQSRNKSDMIQNLQNKITASDLETDNGTDSSLEDHLEFDPVDTNKTDEAIYLDLTYSDQEMADSNQCDESVDITECKGVQYLNEKSRTNDIISKKMNTLKLLKYSNICLFKLTKYCFVCYECLERFKDMQTLRVHVEKSHSYDQIRMKMVKAKYTFHKADITDLECRICSVMLNNCSELESHLISHNVRLKPGGSSLIPYKLCSDTFNCQLCQDKFETRYRLLRHMDGHYFNYVCPECNMGFPNPQSLKKHVHLENGNEISSATHKHVKRKSKFKSRGMVSEEGRFKCSQCPQRFKSDYKRLHHLIQEHKNESKLFKCEFCSKIFMSVHWLTQHMNCYHQNELYN